MDVSHVRGIFLGVPAYNEDGVYWGSELGSLLLETTLYMKIRG